MPTIEDLGKKVKAKYPGQYDDMSDVDVGKRVKEKFPSDYADFTESKGGLRNEAGASFSQPKGAAPKPLPITPAPPQQQDLGPINFRGSAGGLGATAAVGAFALTNPVGWAALTGSVVAATLGGGLGEAMGQMVDLHHNLQAEKEKAQGFKAQPVPAPSSMRESLRDIGAEATTQGAFELGTAGLGAVGKGLLTNVPKVGVKMAESSAAGKAFQAAQSAAKQETKVLGAQAKLAALHDTADEALNAMKGLEGQELKVDRANNAMFLLKNGYQLKREKLAMIVNQSASGLTADLRGESKAFLLDVANYLPPINSPVTATGLHPTVGKYVGAAKSGLKHVPDIDAAHGIGEGLTQRADAVPIGAIIDARKNIYQAIEDGKGSMGDASMGVLRRHADRMDAVIEETLAKQGPAVLEAWNVYKDFYASERKLMQLAVMKVADASPEKLAGLIDNNPASVRAIRKASDTYSPKTGASAPLMDDVRASFMQGIATGKNGKLALENVNAKLAGYGESTAELFRDDRATLDRWKSMGRQAEALLAEAAEKPTTPTASNLVQKAWEIATSQLSSGVAGSAAGFALGHGPGAVLGATGGALTAKLAPEMILQRIAEDPTAYDRWTSAWAKRGSNFENMTKGLASVMRSVTPELLQPIRRAAGAQPKPLPEPN